MEQLPSSIPEISEDYYGKDGLLYCGKCHTPREAFFAKGIALMGKKKHPIECSCQRTEREKQEALINQQKHLDLVRRLKAEGFSDPAMLDWTFENDNGRSPQIRHPQDTVHARIYNRLLEMCVPVSCIGMSFRQETAQEKMERLKSLIG